MSDFLRTTGNCLITNFDTRIKNRKTSSNDVIFKSKNNALSLGNNYNFNQISILDTVGRIAALDGKKDLSFDDLVAAKKMFANNKMVPNLSNVKDVRIDAKRRVGTVQYTDGSIIRMNFSVKESKGKEFRFNEIGGHKNCGTSAVSDTQASVKQSVKTSRTTNPVKNSDKYDGIPKSWIPHIQNLSKTTGYSEELIINIISYESFTPSAKYKKENGGLYEVGFGHTTKANHNNKFSKGFKINIATAFKWLGQDIKDKEAEIKKFGAYYHYDKLSKPMKEAFIDVAFNRGEGRLNPNSRAFDPNYRSVHANIEKGYIGPAAVRLRQEKFYIHEAGLRKRNVQRFLKTIENLPAKQIIASMDLFNRENYYTKTINMLKKNEADSLRRDWNSIYYSAKNAA